MYLANIDDTALINLDTVIHDTQLWCSKYYNDAQRKYKHNKVNEILDTIIKELNMLNEQYLYGKADFVVRTQVYREFREKIANIIQHIDSLKENN